MVDYQKLYCFLFNGMTDIIQQLQQLQRDAEELYIQSGEEQPCASADDDSPAL